MKITKLIANDGFITVNKELIKEFGLHEAILLGCLCSKQDYWMDRGECTPDGFFFCTAEQFEEETTLTAYQQRKAFKTLEDAGVIETKVIGLPARKYFAVCETKLLKILTTRGAKIEQQETEKVNCNNIKDNNIKDNNIKDKSKSTKVDTSFKDECSEIINYLNNVAHTHFRDIESNNKCIRARLRDGFTVDDFKRVIDVKYQDKWFVDNGYFRPQTLFGNKFENYLNEKPKTSIKSNLVTTSGGVRKVRLTEADLLTHDENGNLIEF